MNMPLNVTVSPRSRALNRSAPVFGSATMSERIPLGSFMPSTGCGCFAGFLFACQLVPSTLEYMRRFAHANGFELSPAVRLMSTPGHTAQDISTLAETDGGLVVLTHLWWHADGPQDDPLAENLQLLHANRDKVLALRPALIIPGHGAPFEPAL